MRPGELDALRWDSRGSLSSLSRAGSERRDSALLRLVRMGHRDGGDLVRKLYGHPDAALARERVREAFRQAPPTPVPLTAAR
jgi:hypothetical protein